jgi:antitoxin component YwqK of YwqJK toxin-antitoxin module
MRTIHRLTPLALATALASCANVEPLLDKPEGHDSLAAAKQPTAGPLKPTFSSVGGDELDQSQSHCPDSPIAQDSRPTKQGQVDRGKLQRPIKIGDEEGFLVDGMKDGEWIQFDKTGRKCGMRTYKANVLEGPWNLEVGEVRMEGRHKAGQPEGPSKTTTRMVDGSVCTGTGNYLNGKQHGLWVQVTTGSKKQIAHARSEKVFDNGALVSTTLWHDNGVMSYRVGFRDGRKEGEEKQWHRNGQLERVQIYRRGQLEGVSTFWHANGMKAREEHYKEGKLAGPLLAWHENGQMASETKFVGGKEVGPRRAWGDSGDLVEHWVMVDGARKHLVSRSPGTSTASPPK